MSKWNDMSKWNEMGQYKCLYAKRVKARAAVASVGKR